MTGKNSGSAWWWWKATSLVYEVSKVISQFLPQWAIRASSDERSAARLIYIYYVLDKTSIFVLQSNIIISDNNTVILSITQFSLIENQ